MNWGEIKAAVKAFAHRTDLDTLWSVFLPLAEQRIYFGEVSAPKVRCAAMQTFATLANGALPTGFLEAIKVAENGSPDKPLTFCPLELMPSRCDAFTWDQGKLVLSEDQRFPVDLTYYTKLQTPSADTDTNWLMTNAPNIYISALLVEVARRSRDQEQATVEAGNYASAVASLVSQERASALSGSRLIVRKK